MSFKWKMAKFYVLITGKYLIPSLSYFLMQREAKIIQGSTLTVAN